MSGTVEEVLVEVGDSVEEGQLLAKLDTSEWDKELRTLELDLLEAEINLESAEYSLDKAEDDADMYIVDDWEVDMKELQVELAKARLEDATEKLQEALDASPEIIAPFEGFIIGVNVSGGDEVTKGTVAVTIADPNEFEVDILVSEMDIFDVKLGGEAWVEVDAMDGLSLPAEVTHISPTATIQSGVVNYEVTVEVASLEEMMQEQQAARQEALGNIQQEELPEQIKQAIEEGSITQEQAEAMLEQIQQAPGGQQGEMPAALSEDLQLREGLTVTASIIVEEKIDTLLVLNSAITTRGWQTYVQVLLPDGTTEERVITTGISNWQYTEVTDGLSEGEQVVVPQGTNTTSTTEPEGGFPNGGMMIPGMRGIR
jgi:multidrug efflux pump subunit AcrA (membrane-fusion protein)